MPEMNGFQLLQTLRDDPELAPIPVVMLSAFGPDCAPPSAANVSAWLRKPAEVEQILETVELCREHAPVGA